MSTLGRIMLPHVTPEQVAAFFRATEPAASALTGSFFPVFEPFPRCRLYCQMEIKTLTSNDWRVGPRIVQLGREGYPAENPTGKYIVVDADSMRLICYRSRRGSSVNFVRDLEGDLSFLATTLLPGMAPVVEARLEAAIAPLGEWISY